MFIPRWLLQGKLVDKSGRYALGCPRSLLRRCCYKYDDVPRLDVRILPLQQSTMSLEFNTLLNFEFKVVDKRRPSLHVEAVFRERPLHFLFVEPVLLDAGWRGTGAHARRETVCGDVRTTIMVQHSVFWKCQMAG